MADDPGGDLLVRVSNVDVSFGPHKVLDDVSLAVHADEIVSLIGPNGSGKTTLVRVVLGLLTPDRGRVHRRKGLIVGYMPQRLAVDETLPLTVAGFLRLGGPVAATDMRATLDEVGAGPLIHSQLRELSGGELRRVALARALLRDPDLLVLDEPVQGVDITGQAELHRLITRVRERHGCGVLLISHDLHVVMAATDRVVCLNHHVCCTGRPEAVSRDPAYRTLFGPQTAEALAVYSHHHDHRHDERGDVVAPRETGPGGTDVPESGRERRHG